MAASRQSSLRTVDSLNRDNAILLKGSPISFLPTSGIFAYVTHFDANLLGLEWVDDTTCVLVFESTSDARSAFRLLQKSLAEEPSRDDGTVTAKPIPVPIWPTEARINATLGRAGGDGDGLRGILRMRWARADDVKKRGAREESQFYKTYGDTAGKLLDDGPVGPLVKRRRGEPADADEAMERAKLDAELDKFIAGDDAPDPEPMSRMRSDYIGRDGKTLLDRTSDIRAHPVELEDRVTAPLPRRARGRRGGDRQERDDGPAEPRSGGGRGNRDRTRGHRQPRPRLTQADLDAELDAFLKRDD